MYIVKFFNNYRTYILIRYKMFMKLDLNKMF